MEHNKLKKLFTIAVAINIMLISYIFFYSYTTKKIAVVNTMTLFSHFTMTAEFKHKGETELSRKKQHLEELYEKTAIPSISNNERQNLLQQLKEAEIELEDFSNSFETVESSKIWSRIDAYTEEFAKEHNYKLVVDSKIRTTALYADQNTDVTKELLLYINKRYDGLK